MNEEKLNNFKYFILERNSIYVKRQRGLAKPWSDDIIFQNFIFTDIYKSVDVFYQWVQDKIIKRWHDSPNLWFAVCVARQIGHHRTLKELNSLLIDFNPDEFLKVLRSRKCAGKLVHTNRYMLTTHGKSIDKISYTTKILSKLWWQKTLVEIIFDTSNSLESSYNALKGFEGFGSFISYEIIYDLIESRYFKNAEDKDTFCRFGISTQRALNRIFTRKENAFLTFRQYLSEIISIKDIFASDKNPTLKALTLADISHCLAMYEKYCRIKEGKKTKLKRFACI
jgi:hypothetical protein